MSERGQAVRARLLVDPNVAIDRGLPRDDRDLMIGAQSNHLLVLDNLSSLSARMSDALCRLAVGGAFVTKQLYRDADEVILRAQRPVAITAITDVIRRPTCWTGRSCCPSSDRPPSPADRAPVRR